MTSVLLLPACGWWLPARFEEQAGARRKPAPTVPCSGIARRGRVEVAG